MRCFISIDFDEEIKKQILKIQEKLPEFKGKKTERENFHLTLKFLGEIDEKKVEEVKERLKKIKFKKFNLSFESLGVFSENYIRIVWLSLKGAEELQKEIDVALGDLFKKEKRFMGHLTIGRVKGVRSKKEFLDKLKKIKFDKITFVGDNFELKESVLSESGPIYSDLEVYPLE